MPPLLKAEAILRFADGDSDGRVPTSTRARLIHTVCECDQARYMKQVKMQIQNFIIFGVDALII